MSTIIKNTKLEPVFQTVSGQGVMALDIPDEDAMLPYQWRMLQENQVPGLLPFSSIRRGSRATLCWRVASLQPLTLLFERRCRTVQDMMHLVRQLYRILFRMEGLLLDEKRLLLDNRYMMADPVSMELQLAYVPLSEWVFGENPVRRLLQQWIMGDCRLSGEASGGLPELVTLLNNPDFHWSHLGAVCNELPLNEKLSEPVARDRADNPESKSDAHKKMEPSLNNASIRKGESARTGNPYGNRLDVSIRLPWKEGVEFKPPAGRKYGKDGLLRMVAIQIPVLIMLLFALSGGLTGGGGADGTAAWAGFSLVLTALEALAFMRKPDGGKGDNVNGKSDGKGNGRENDRAKEKADTHRPGAGLGESFECTYPVHESVYSRSGRAEASSSGFRMPRTTGTLLLPASDNNTRDFETLGQTLQLPIGNGRYLLYESKNGRQARMDLDKMPFLLGRYRDQVDGCLEHPAVGKIHAEIRETKDGLTIVDLNSKNGTCINGNSLSPYLAVPILPGDIIRLANEELTFACDAECTIS